ncbi:alpha-glucosidase [Corallococcus interemptor]|uniref:Alpha-glucosidase n=1 Tax=Corallococcus interemptor TaxID=2316720 RepID=A0A3A8QMS7_9BACT|nr:glycoside hydrolase family 31 protein [Corallococcus interemptor]RKH48815.1 alpha-glucosidase [Corallococcus sp. AB050B]RKH67655.1 alpha-glucosidase [Corallococcus interemptor]
MHVTDAHVESHRLRLSGRHAVLEVSCPLPGVLRVRHAPVSSEIGFLHPVLPDKRSWAVVAEGGHALKVERDGERVRVTAEGASLEVDAEPGTWRFMDARGRELARCVDVSGDVQAEYPMSRHRARLTLRAPDGERYLGFGEKVGPLDKRGMHFTFWNTDVVPHHPDTDPLYQSIPFFVGLREGIAWGFFLDESWRSEVDVALADASRLAWESWGPELDCYLFAGPGPADVVRKYAALTGRPPLPPLWSLGAQQSRWGYENAQDIRGVIEGYRRRDLPLDCVYLDIDYMDGYKVWTWDNARYPDPAGLAREAAAQGVRLVPIIDPALKLEAGWSVYEDAKAREYLVRYDRGGVLVGEVWPRPAVFPDLTRPEVQRWWGGLHRDFVTMGMAGFWNDMNEPSCFAVQPDVGILTLTSERAEGMGKVEGKTLPYDARHGDKRHLEVHNVYALGMAKGAFEGLRELRPEARPFLLTRAGFAGIQRYSAVWTGDNSSHWTQLETSLPMLMGLGLAAVAHTGVDIPGFIGRANGELLVRWMQTGTFYPLMRNHAGKGTSPQEPWRFGEPYLTLARAALERRYRLLPTLYTLMHEASETGLAPLRPLLMEAPGDAEAVGAFDQFLFGRDLLVAPVVRPGQTKRLAYLPAGTWLEWPGLERTGEVREGGRHVIADGPLDTVPVWLRAGGVVALTRPAMHTTDANWKHLEWHVHAGPEVHGRLYEDAGDGYGESRLTALRGGVTDGVLRLERSETGTLARVRTEETVRVYGLKSVSQVTGARAHRFENGVLELQVAAGWTRLEVRGPGVP